MLALSCAAEERKWVEPLITAAWPNAGLTETQPGSTRYENAVGKIEVTDRYFRAFAKIGFHYFLPNSTDTPATNRCLREFVSSSLKMCPGLQ